MLYTANNHLNKVPKKLLPTDLTTFELTNCIKMRCNYSGCVLPATSRSPTTTMYVITCGIGKNIHNSAGNIALKVHFYKLMENRIRK